MSLTANALRALPHPAVALWLVLSAALIPSSRAAGASIARVWNERALEGIRMDTPHPPAQARNLFSLSVAMYDVWAAYDTNGAVGYTYRGKHTASDVAAARREAISYAAYRLLTERHAYSRTATNQPAFNDAAMQQLGYDPANQSRDTSTPAGLGNTIYDAVSAWFLNDGSRQTNGVPFPLANPPVPYPDYPAAQGGYAYLNPPLNPFIPGISDGSNHTVVDINVWQRLIVANSVDQNGFPQNPLQRYLGAQWLGVRPFALVREDSSRPWIDPGPPPFFGGPRDAEFKSNLLEVIRCSSHLTVDDSELIDVSPAGYGNNTLGANDGHGYDKNPVTGLPYQPKMIARGDFARGLAEYWADGPSSETPPGHWNAIANSVADSPEFSKRIGGVGPVVDDLEWDVKVYLALNAALHDAACAAWSIKRYYNGWRPIGPIRYLGMQGQSSDPNLPSYSTNGLPLVTGLIELVTDDTVASGRHAGLTPGKVAVYCWPGQPEDPLNTYSGVKWQHAETWMPYQKNTFVTPGFPGYVSGHSTFSRAAAEVLTSITGSPWFPGGFGSTRIHTLVNEMGPSAPFDLEWASYYDAADQAGLSRLYGGIHPPVDDFTGRRVGAQCGKEAWALVKKYFDGSILNQPVLLALNPSGPNSVQLRFNTLRGFYYKVQSTPSLNLPFVDEDTVPVLAYDTFIRQSRTPDSPSRFYRVVPMQNHK